MHPSHYFTVILFFTFSSAAHTQSAPTYDVNTVDPGGLYFATETPGRVVRTPTLKSNVTIRVNGPVVYTRVTQHFKNTGTAWVEGIYTYPLPKGSAVDQLTMQIGSRIIKGEIQEKQKALNTFKTAASEGKRASLIIQKRPNIFTTRLANIGPGETIKVTIEYQDLLAPRDNIFELRFPMVVRPRYTPGIPLDTTQISAGWGFNTDQVPDGASISQPYLPGGAAHNHNPVTLKVNLNAGFKIDSVSSPSHRVDIHRGEVSAVVTLNSGDTPADQDFILRWTPEKNAAPQVGVFKETTDSGTHNLLMVMPPVSETDPRTAKTLRELIIVLDRSGSMGGQAIRQAKAAVRRAVMRLGKDDHFNIITFSSGYERLFAESTAVTDHSIHAALDFIDSVEAGGGTEMSGALSMALDGPHENTTLSERVKQVIFITDGAVGNEEDLMGQIKTSLGSTRFFTVGIGSAPNNYFMSEAAIFGKGTYINIAMNDDVLSAMNRLFQKIESPQMTNLRIIGADGTADIVPGVLPDLYSGEPIVLLIKSDTDKRPTLILEGDRQGTDWTRTIDAEKGMKASGIASLWARRKIEAINRSYIGQRHSSQDERREKVLTLALGYHLVSEFTSLVAVEKEAAKPAHEPLFKRETPANLPAGMSAKRLTIASGLVSTRNLALKESVTPRSTATPMALYLLIGLLLLALSLTLWLSNRRRKTT